MSTSRNIIIAANESFDVTWNSISVYSC